MMVSQRPAICPHCGELVIVWCCPVLDVVLYPDHEDLIFPGSDCPAGAWTAPGSGRIVTS